MAPDQFHIQVDQSLSALKFWMEQSIAREKTFVLVDQHTEKHCLPILKQVSPVFANSKLITIAAGEEHKNMDSLLYILKLLSDHQANRNSLLISLGGGVICDIGGFAASIYKRGIRSILVPTTLLSQVDAAYGGKTGVDFLGHKNQVGTFSFPEKIFVSTQFLSTLPEPEKLNGIAEAFKHALIADHVYWNQIKNDPLKNLDQLISESIRIKTSIVEKDPHEKNIRKILNAGHTVGHAIESAFLLEGSPIPHGQAVAAGLIIELYLSHKMGYLEDKELKETIPVIDQYFPRLDITSFKAENLVQFMRQDKKNPAENISFSLIRKIGEATWDDHMNEDLIVSGINYYLAR